MSISSYNSTTGELTTYAGSPNVDQVLSASSKNPIANKAVYNALAEKIEKTVNDLVNYYTTSQVYNKAEVRELIGAINTLTLEVVGSLPTSDISDTTIYLVGPTSGNYDEYIHVGNTWVKIGDTQIDLSNYVTSEALTTALQSYYTKTAVDTLLDSYYTKSEIDTELNTKQDTLTFDNKPTNGSANPVKSGGIYSALAKKQDTLTFDNTPTENSANVVKSGGVYSAVDDVYKVMGQNGGGKNLNIYPYHETTETKNGITFTDNGDGTITANGTSTAVAQFFCHLRTNTSTEQNNLIVPNGTYIISGCPSDINGAAVIVTNITENGVSANKGTDRGNGDTFTVDGDDYYDDRVDLGILIYVYSGKTLDNVTFRPMLRLASDIDNTWQPYAKTNLQLTEDKAEQSYLDNMLGKNLIPFPYTNFGGFPSGSKYGGVTYTYENDGTIVVNGTCTNTSYFSLIQGLKFPLDTTKKYTLSIETENGKASVYFGTDLTTPSTEFAVRSVENGYGEVTFTPWTNNYTRSTLAIYVIAGTYDNLRIKVMLRYAENKDPSYVPYDSRTSQTIKTSINNLIALNRYNGAKNLIPRPYHGEKQYGTTHISNGITWTVEDDGTITVNGTATSTSYYNILYTSKIFDAERTYITSINASNLDGNGSINLFQRCDITGQSTHDVINMPISYDGENNRIFVPENNGEYDIDVIGLYVRPNVTINNAKVKFMVRAIEDVDSTYVPYAKNNKQLTDEIIPANAFNELGSKNLLPYPYLSKTNTTNGLTFTDNGDGTVTVNGTATAETIYTFYQGAGLNLIQGQEYIATGCPAGGSLATYRIQWANSAWSFQKNDTGGGVTFSLNNPSTDYLGYIRIDIQDGTVCDNLVFKPMIRPASIVDDTYVPYAMTNRELTEHHTTVAKTFTQSSADVATYLRNANTSGYIAFGYSYNRTMITVNAIFTIKASGNALYKSDGTTATSGNENWELIKISNFPYSKAIPNGPLSGLLFLNRTDLKDLYCSKRGNDLIFTIGAIDYADFVGKDIRLSVTVMLK